MEYIAAILIGVLIGYFAPKIKKRKKGPLPDFEHTPPPPPPSEKEKPLHKKPGWLSSYNGGYVSTVKCKKCGYTGMALEMWMLDPCPLCGGSICPEGAAKWSKIDGVWQWVKAER